MTNGELFIRENPTIEVKINGSCVWIYYFEGVNHYTIPTEWWNKEIGVFDKIRAEIRQAADKQFQIAMGIADLNERYTHIQMENAYRHSLNIVDKYTAEVKPQESEDKE